MSNDYYNPTGWPATSSTGTSSTARSEMTLVQAGFDKMVALTGNASKFVRVNSGASAQEAVSATGTGNVVLSTSPTIVSASLTNNTYIGGDQTDFVKITGASGSATLTMDGLTADAYLFIKGKGTGGVYLGTNGGFHAAIGAGYSGGVPSDYAVIVGSTGSASASIKTSSRGIELTGGNGYVGVGGQPSTSSNTGGLQIRGSIKGIYLGNGANADGNVLDWYEEGTFTPVLTAATAGDLSVAYSLRTGRFTRIGNRVFVNICITTSTFTYTTASGNLKLTGLPYTSVNLSGTSRNVGAVDFSGMTKANYTQVSAVVPEASSQVFLEASGSGQAVTLLNVSDFPSAGTVVLHMNFSYEV